jgi:hypothetical protein
MEMASFFVLFGKNDRLPLVAHAPLDKAAMKTRGLCHGNRPMRISTATPKTRSHGATNRMIAAHARFEGYVG